MTREEELQELLDVLAALRRRAAQARADAVEARRAARELRASVREPGVPEDGPADP